MLHRPFAAALLAAALALAAPARAQMPSPSQAPTQNGAYAPVQPHSEVYPDPGDGHAHIVQPGDGLPTADPNSASYTLHPVITPGGATIPVTRGVAADCTAAGVVVLTWPDGPMNWTVAAGHQNQGYGIIGIASSTATCVYYGLR